jgi:hypothetical protein
MQDWSDTSIWAELKSRTDQHSEAARQALTNHMPGIEVVLRQAGTSPSDFTLHDDQHAFRVAERMIELIPGETLLALSGYELALLLFSAYLHDIGMTPQRGRVLGHYEYLLNGQSERISADEARTFRRWLDEHGRGATPPLIKTMAAGSALSTAPKLVTSYCRERHAQWSVDWISTNLPSALATYSTWRTDLEALCRSHNEGRGFLLSKSLDPRIVAPSAVVNLRYLACVLRVADVMEVDPERTPPVLFGHRGIEGDSATYWLKDRELVLTLNDKGVTVTARPPSAVIQRAVIVTADQIDAELYVCRDLADLGSFAFCPGAGPLSHTWPWPTTSFRDIAPAKDAFVYIDGDFQPDTARVLELLGGVALYETPLAALRELLQNAEDAVSEQIARTRLAWDDPADHDQVAALRALNRIDITLEHRADGYWLHCADTGVGMTQRVITGQFLASGSTHGNALAELKRRCSQAGFEFYRTGRFGVGVLSYFMIAEEIRIQTRRSSETGEAEDHAWEFVSEGLESFGELRKCDQDGHGTTVSLRLQEKIADTIDEWLKDADEYLDFLLVDVPCSVTFDLGSGGKKLAPGWATALKTIAVRLADKSQEGRLDRWTDPDYLSERQREVRARLSASQRELRRELREALVFDETTGTLQDDLGSYRVVVPYFCLPGGNSFAYARASEECERILFGTLQGPDVWLPRGQVVTAWNGMAITTTPTSLGVSQSNIWLEVNFTGDAAGRPAVNRNSFVLSVRGREVLQALDENARARRQELARAWHDSIYRGLNNQVAGISAAVDDTRWLRVDNGGSREWTKVEMPAMPSTYGVRDRTGLLTEMGEIAVVRPLRELSARYRPEFDWWPGGAGPDMMLYNAASSELVPVWSSGRDGDSPHPLGLTARFPPNFRTLVMYSCDVRDGSDEIWNGEHPLVRAITQDSLSWCEAHLPQDRDPLNIATEILGDQGRCAAWLAKVVTEDQSELWESIVDREPTFLEKVWALMGFGDDSGFPTLKCWSAPDEGLEVGVRSWSTYDEGEISSALDFGESPDAWVIR